MANIQPVPSASNLKEDPRELRRFLDILRNQLNSVIGTGSAVMSSAVIEERTQVGHGLSAGNAIYYDGANWQKAISSGISTVGIALCSSVASTDKFTITYSGKITGLSGFTTGNWYFVSDSTAGALSLSPGTTIVNPIAIALSTSALLVIPMRADQATEIYGLTSRSEFDSVSSAYMYTGRAARGSGTASAVWKISRYDYNDGTILFADGDELYNNIWDNREALSYS